MKNIFEFKDSNSNKINLQHDEKHNHYYVMIGNESVRIDLDVLHDMTNILLEYSDEDID